MRGPGGPWTTKSVSPGITASSTSAGTASTTAGASAAVNNVGTANPVHRVAEDGGQSRTVVMVEKALMHHDPNNRCVGNNKTLRSNNIKIKIHLPIALLLFKLASQNLRFGRQFGG
jgi:hypothetical protein